MSTDTLTVVRRQYSYTIVRQPNKIVVVTSGWHGGGGSGSGGGATLDEWVDGQTYQDGDTVVHEFNIWRNGQNGQTSEPGAGDNGWEMISQGYTQTSLDAAPISAWVDPTHFVVSYDGFEFFQVYLAGLHYHAYAGDGHTQGVIFVEPNQFGINASNVDAGTNSGIVGSEDTVELFAIDKHLLVTEDDVTIDGDHVITQPELDDGLATKSDVGHGHDFTELSGVATDAQLPAGIARDAEVATMIDTAINQLIAGSPGLLDTLNEIAAAIGDDPDFATHMTQQLALKIAYSDFNANTILGATIDDTPIPITVDEERLFGRLTGGVMGGLTQAQVRTFLGLASAAYTEVTDYQPIDADLTNIAALTTTTFGRNLLTLANLAALQSLLGLGGAAYLAVGTTAGTVAAGDDARVVGARLWPTAVKTADYTLVAQDLARFNASAGNITALLPNAPADGTRCGLKNVVDPGAFSVTWQTQGADKINLTGGVTSGTLAVNGQASIVQYYAADAVWIVVSTDTPLAQLDTRYASNRRTKRVYTVASTATLTPEIDTYDIFKVTALAGAMNVANHVTSTATDGEFIRIRITDDGTARALTFGTDYVSKGGITLPTTTVANKRMELGFEWWSSLGAWNLVAQTNEI